MITLKVSINDVDAERLLHWASVGRTFTLIENALTNWDGDDSLAYDEVKLIRYALENLHLSWRNEANAVGVEFKTYGDLMLSNDGNTVRIDVKGKRALTELPKLTGTEFSRYITNPNGWYLLKTLVDKSNTPGLQSLMIDAIIDYFATRRYSIIAPVGITGIDKLLLSKGFVPVDYARFKNTVLKWTKR